VFSLFSAVDDNFEFNVARLPPPPPPVEVEDRQDEFNETAASDRDAYSLQPLLDELGDRWQFWWIKQRIQLLWSELNDAGRHVTNASCMQKTGPRLRVTMWLVFFLYCAFS